MAAAFGLLGALALWRDRWVWHVLLPVAAIFALAAVAAPRVLAPVERWWMRVAERMSRVMTVVVLALTYAVLITPLGVIRRWFGADTLGLRFDSRQASYWVRVEPDGPSVRHDKPY